MKIDSEKPKKKIWFIFSELFFAKSRWSFFKIFYRLLPKRSFQNEFSRSKINSFIPSRRFEIPAILLKPRSLGNIPNVAERVSMCQLIWSNTIRTKNRVTNLSSIRSQRRKLSVNTKRWVVYFSITEFSFLLTKKL